VWDGQQFAPRLMPPLSLSYDHRVVDGAEAARFTNLRYLQNSAPKRVSAEFSWKQ
jgi:pyruvate/2-oxoglutarate dehydrogenase complex dihydrolipoamide acyltransferase (E2) component